MFWMLLGIGALFVTVDAMQLYGAFALGIALDRAAIIAIGVMGALAPACFWTALIFWFRLKR